MAYVEVRKDGKLVKRRLVDDDRAHKGCRIRVGSAGQVHLRAGESKAVGKYEIAMLEGSPPDDGHEVVRQLGTKSDSFPAMSETEQAGFTGPAQAGPLGQESPVPVIEDYEVTGRLGQGGMGTVWRAVQLSTKREVALKFLGRHRFASKRSRARFEREVSLAAKLTHSNIACVYDSGLHRGVYYYAMELVDGVHLDKYVQQNHLSQREILVLMKGVCDAVGYAHEKGIIHRDLKPSNILVTEDGRPHVVDFGLAKASMDEDDDVTISVDGEITGTLAYMSPEQAAGRLDKIGEPTDVYSLGVILHQMLTGRLPHDVSGSRYDVVKRIVEDDVQSPRAYDDSVDSDLESLILTALAQDPEDRYPSVVVLLQDIDNYLNREPLLARSMSTTYRIRKRFRKYAKPIAKTLLRVMVVAAIIVIAYCLVSSERRKRIEAERLAGLRTEGISEQPEQATPNELIDGPEGVTDSEEVKAIKSVVHRYQDGWKRANRSNVLEEVISDKAYAVVGPDQRIPSTAGIWDKAAAIELATNMPIDTRVVYGIKSVSVFGPLAYVLGTYTRIDEDGTKHEAEPIYYLAKDETGWKFISAGSALHVRKTLSMRVSSTQETTEDENARVAIRTLMDRINASWTKKNGTEVLKTVLSDNAFAFAMQRPDNPAEALILNRQTFCELYGKMQKEQPLQRQEHTIETVTVFGPLAYDVGITLTTDPNKKQSYHRSLNFFAKDETGWKMYFSTSAENAQELLDSDTSDEQKIRKLAEEYVNDFRLDELFPLERIDRICSDDFVVIMSGGEMIAGKQNYIKRFSQGLEQLRSAFSALLLKLEVQSVDITDSSGKVEGKIVWRGRLRDGAKSFNTNVSVSLTFNKTNGKWLLVREEQKKVEPDTPDIPGVLQDSQKQSWMPRRTAAPMAIQVNGKPFFVVCTDGADTNDLSEYEQAGFNTVLLSDSNSVGFSEANKLGLHVISELPFDTADRELSPSDWTGIQHRLVEDTDQRSLLSWTSAVPPWGGFPRVHKNLKRISEEAKRVSSKTPVFISINPPGTNGLRERIENFSYSDGFVLITHIIPERRRQPGIPTEVSTISFWVDQILNVVESKPLWAAVGRYDGFRNITGPKRIQTKNDQLMSMAYLAVNHGATGILIPAYDEKLHVNYKDKTLKSQLAKALQILSPAILTGAVLDEVTISNDNGKIDFKAYAAPDNQRIYLVAVNTSDAEVQPTFFIPNMRGTVHILNELRDIPRPNGQFSDKFEPYQTHVYDIRMKQDIKQEYSDNDVDPTAKETNISEITDRKGNLQGNTQKAYLDIIKASVSEEGENCVFTVTTADDFPAPKQLGNDDTFTFIWFVDIDRNRATGQNRSGNDYNIHLGCSNKSAWRTGWYKTTDASKQDGITIDRKEIIIRIKDNTATLIFPKNYLPSDQFDWWVNTWTRPTKGSFAASNPLTQRATFKMSLSGR